MALLISNATVYCEGKFVPLNISVCNGRIVEFSLSFSTSPATNVLDFNNCFVFPGFSDVHVHLREPGFSYKETIKMGTLAAAHGGFTSVCAMPNLSPVPDSAENLKAQLDAIKKDAVVHVYPYGAITKGEQGIKLSDIKEIAPDVIAFSDDGRGVQTDSLMRQAMAMAKKYNKIIAAHCEDNTLLNGGYIHDGEYSAKYGHKGIPSESEWRQVERDLKLVKETGCAYHICHVSSKESVALIRKAKAEQLDVTCETAPHYLLLNDMDLQDCGRFKMNPPIRSEADRQALIEGICDGTIDMIATDHAPHSEEEKSKDLKGSIMGVVGLEVAFPILYTQLVKRGVISLEKLIKLMFDNPSKRFGIGSALKIGNPADLTVFDLNEEYVIDPDSFLSKGRSTPFAGEKVFGKCIMTMVNGQIVWQDKGVNT